MAQLPPSVRVHHQAENNLSNGSRPGDQKAPYSDPCKGRPTGENTSLRVYRTAVGSSAISARNQSLCTPVSHSELEVDRQDSENETFWEGSCTALGAGGNASSRRDLTWASKLASERHLVKWISGSGEGRGRVRGCGEIFPQSCCTPGPGHGDISGLPQASPTPGLFHYFHRGYCGVGRENKTLTHPPTQHTHLLESLSLLAGSGRVEMPPC